MYITMVTKLNNLISYDPLVHYSKGIYAIVMVCAHYVCAYVTV